MFATVTLNPCIDKTVSVPKFSYGGTNKIQSIQYEYAGKGINVAKAISHMGYSVTSTGFLYEEDFQQMKKSLSQYNIDFNAVICPGKLRVNTKIFDLSERVSTELNEIGNPVQLKQLEELLLKIENIAKKSKIMIFSGSLPPNCPCSFYKEAIEKCSPYCKTILDTEGEKLIEGIKAKPTIIKPNLFELEKTFGLKLNSKNDIKEAAIKIVKNQGVQIVCVSLGSEGALITNGEQTYFAQPVNNITVKGTVCAGDCLVAGIATGYCLNLSLDNILRRGVAAATACVVQGNSRVTTQELLDEFLPKIVIESI